MRGRVLLFLFTGIVLLFPSFGYAQQDTGSIMSGAYLMKLCEMDKNGEEVVKGGHTACQSYIAGMIDYHKLLRSLGTAPSIDICVPNTVKLRHLQNIVWKYLAQSAHHDAFNAAPAISLALFEYYPCK